MRIRRRGGGRSRADKPVAWTREKLLALLAAGLVVCVLLGVGLVLAVVNALRPADGRAPAPSAAVGQPAAASPPAAGETGPVPTDERDALAARPMATVPSSAAWPSAMSLQDPGAPIVLPPSTRTGPAGVPTGFPRTPEGALAQLAALNAAALSSGSLSGARAVIAGWALPGGPTTSTWSGVRAMAALLQGAGVAGGSSSLAIVATPLMGQIKGSVGTGFVVPCVDFELTVTVTTTVRGAVADCQRMVWTDDRWMIGPGTEPVDPPSVWPGTELAAQVGYRDLRRG